MDSLSTSGRTSLTDITARDVSPSVAPKLHKPIFAEPGTIPLPDAGFKELGVVWENLAVHGVGKEGQMKTVEGLEVALLKVSLTHARPRSFSPTYRPDTLQMWYFPGFVKRLFNITYGSPSRPLISGFSGVVPHGQTLLVLGRPGSGCSTLRKSSLLHSSTPQTWLGTHDAPDAVRALANTVDSFVKVDGEVHYGSITQKEAGKVRRYSYQRLSTC